MKQNIKTNDISLNVDESIASVENASNVKTSPKKLMSYKQKIGWTILWSVILNGTVSLLMVPLGIISGAIFSTLTGTAGFFATISSGLGFVGLGADNVGATADTVFAIVYWISWTTMNTIVIIWGYITYKKHSFDIKFMHLTIVFVVVGLLTGAGISAIQGLTEQTFIPSIFTWTTDAASFDPNANQAAIKVASYVEMIFFCIIGGIIISYSTYQMLRIGSSTGGLDPVGYFVSVKKGVDFGKFNLMFTLYNQIIFIVLNFWILQFVFANDGGPTYSWLFAVNDDGAVVGKEGFALAFSLLLEPRVVGSLIYMLAFNIPLFILFPRNAKSKLEISASNVDTFIGQIKNSNFNHQMFKVNSQAIDSKTSQTILYTVVNKFEVENAVRFFNTLDPNVIVSVSPATQIYGNFYNDAMEFNYKLNEVKAKEVVDKSQVDKTTKPKPKATSQNKKVD